MGGRTNKGGENGTPGNKYSQEGLSKGQGGGENGRKCVLMNAFAQSGDVSGSGQEREGGG